MQKKKMPLTNKELQMFDTSQYLHDDVLRLVATIRALQVENKVIRDKYETKLRQNDEFCHATGHLLDCAQGTSLCKDCKRMMQAALKFGRS